MVNLVTVPDVELMRTGKWDLSTGEWECTDKEITAAIDAHDKGLLRKPVIRIGHNDPRFSGDPAVGWIDNLRASDDGQALIGDMVGVPEWLAEILPSAYPSRSIEGLYDYTAPDGSSHDFVLTGLALLGATKPGVESLQSLQDVARLYDIAAAGQVGGKAIELIVTAAANSDDEASEPHGAGPYADPGYLDGDGKQVSKSGNKAVKRYWLKDADHVRNAWAEISKPKNADQYTPNQLARIKTRIKQEAKKFGIKIEAASASEEKGAIVASFMERLAEHFGLDADADEDAILEAAAKAPTTDAATEETPTEGAEPHAVAASAPAVNGLMQIDPTQYRELVAAAEEGRQARLQQINEADEQTVAAAIRAGKVPPARKQHWLKSLKADREGTQQVLASLAPGLIPVSEKGHSLPDEREIDTELENVHNRVMASLGFTNTKGSN